MLILLSAHGTGIHRRWMFIWWSPWIDHGPGLISFNLSTLNRLIFITVYFHLILTLNFIDHTLIFIWWSPGIDHGPGLISFNLANFSAVSMRRTAQQSNPNNLVKLQLGSLKGHRRPTLTTAWFPFALKLGPTKPLQRHALGLVGLSFWNDSPRKPGILNFRVTAG